MGEKEKDFRHVWSQKAYFLSCLFGILSQTTIEKKISIFFFFFNNDCPFPTGKHKLQQTNKIHQNNLTIWQSGETEITRI